MNIFLSQARDANASPWPWKNRKDKAKSNTNMRTREMTTALVVDSPTPLAPPVVVKPHEQLTCSRHNLLLQLMNQQSLSLSPHKGYPGRCNGIQIKTCIDSASKRERLTMAMMVPNTHDLIMDVMRSHPETALCADSMITLAGTSYTRSASIMLQAKPAIHRKRVSSLMFS